MTLFATIHHAHRKSKVFYLESWFFSWKIHNVIDLKNSYNIVLGGYFILGVKKKCFGGFFRRKS